MSSLRVLISGAGIAGMAMAHQAVARGMTPIVLERSDALRSGGQNVDVRGAARNVARRMGIDGAIRAANTGEIGMRILDDTGREVAAFPVDDTGPDGPTAELEILRGELARILYERTCDDVDYRFGTTLADVDDRGDGVIATLSDGSVVNADLLVIAEGLRATNRALVDLAQFEDLGVYFVYFAIPRRDTDDQWWTRISLPGGRGVSLRPDHLGTTRAILTVASAIRGLENLTPHQQVDIVTRTFADIGDPVPRILDALDPATMYFDAAGRVASSRWVRSRIVLLGDSAHTNATFGGIGTSNALIGAYVLVGELSTAPSVAVALNSYEALMRDVVATGPPVSRESLQKSHPQSRWAVRFARARTRFDVSAVGRAVGALRHATTHQVSPATGVQLSDYATPAPSGSGTGTAPAGSL